MLLNRHRLLRLIELAELERRVTGPERMLREEDVALLVKAAYDDATDLARAEFLARVRPMPTSAWPWSAVQATTPRSGNARGGGANVVWSPAPGALAPAALVLLRGQANGADVDPGDRVPDRGQPEAAAWEPLHKALDLWDTATIKHWIGPQGWVVGGTATSGVSPSGGQPSSGQPSGGGQSSNGQPSGGVQPSGGQPSGGQPSGGQPSGGPPTGDTETGPAPFSWKHPAVIATGATVATTVGVTLYALRSRRRRPVSLAAPSVPPAGAVPPRSEEPT
jgi:hypothetical protein